MLTRRTLTFNLCIAGLIVNACILGTDPQAQAATPLSPVAVSAIASGPSTVLISVTSDGVPANGSSAYPALSANGRFVAFVSEASDLVANDTNGLPDVFVRDLQTGQTQRISVATGGAQANGGSTEPDISADGRYVTFASYASNLVPDDTNGEWDGFIHDTQTKSTTRFAIGTVYNPTLSSDGRFVVFSSFSSGLVSGDTNGVLDVFIYDRQTGLTERMSLASNGAQGNAGSYASGLSADARLVVFESGADNLVPGDTNRCQSVGCTDVFVRDRQTGQTTRVSVATGGAQADGDSTAAAISADGRYVTFWSAADNLVSGPASDNAQLFSHDRQTGVTELVVPTTNGAPPDGSFLSRPALSADGRFVAFDSSASNLVAGDSNLCVWNSSGLLQPCPDVFVRDRQTGYTQRVSLAANGEQGNYVSSGAAISADGRYVAFASGASNLVQCDKNGESDVFVHDRLSGPLMTTLNLPADGGHMVFLPLILNRC